MAQCMGNERTRAINLLVMKINKGNNFLYLKGDVIHNFKGDK